MSKKYFENQYFPSEYDLYLHIKEDAHILDARVSIIFEKRGDADVVYLDCKENIDIKSITQNEIELRYDCDGNTLIIYRSQDQDISLYPITIEYSFTPVFSNHVGVTYENGFFSTEFEPNGTSYLLPCFNDPGTRSKFSVTLRIPVDFQGVSNMPVQSIKQIGDEVELSFMQTPPMCSYLLCIVVGIFSQIQGQSESGTLITFYTPISEQDKYLPCLDTAIRAFDWLEKHLDVKYELPQLQLISLPIFSGGMENYGLITLEAMPEHHRYYSFLRIIVHEIVHMWFGDLVSIDSFDSIWLNEGWAHFFEYALTQELCPESHSWESFLLTNRFALKNADSSRLSGKITCSWFAYIIYSKGGYVVKMFRDLIGNEQFIAFCSYYIKQFRNKTVGIPDFLQCANTFLKRDCSSFFNPWLRKKGFPVLYVIYDQENKGINIVQYSFSGAQYEFMVSIMYEFNGEIRKTKLLIKDETTDVKLDFDWILVNNDLYAQCYVIYQKDLLEKLVIAKNENRLSSNDLFLINTSINQNSIPFIVNSEIMDLANKFIEEPVFF